MHSEMLRAPRLWILALTVSFPAVLAVLFTPALPELSQFFHISASVAQTSMTTYLFGYAIGMLLYGPAASRFGRKKAMLSGFVLALIGTLLTLWSGAAQLFWLFCVTRFVQGLGASSGMTLSMTMVADTHAGEKATRVVSYLILAATTVPALGLGIGGMLISAFGWEGSFVFMAIYCVLMIMLASSLPETATKLNKDALIVSEIARQYRRQFTDPFLVFHALVTGLCTSCYYFYMTLGPYVGIETVGLPPEVYGWLALIPVAGMGSGCLLSARLAGRQSPRITMLSGLLLALVGVLIMLIGFASGYVTIASFFLPMMIVQIGLYIMSPTSLSVALNEAADKSSASAASQFMNLGTSFCSVLILSLIPSENPLILPALTGAALVLILAIWLKLKAHHERLMRKKEFTTELTENTGAASLQK